MSLVLPLALLLSADPSIAGAVVRDSGCGPKGRALDLEGRTRATVAEVNFACAFDRTGRNTARHLSIRLPGPASNAPLLSLYASDTRQRFRIMIDPVGTEQHIRVGRSDGGLCVALRVRPRVKPPLARRFTGPRGDWQGSIEYAITSDCRYVAMIAGNSVAIANTDPAVRFDIEGLTVETR